LERLKETSRLFLRDAEKDLTNKKYATCIVHLHMAAEHVLKAHLVKLGEEIQFKTLPEALTDYMRSMLLIKTN